MATPDAIDQNLWIRGVHARKRSGLSQTSLVNLSLAGKIRTLALPGLSVRYRGEDCDLIRRELAKVPATVSV